MLIKRNVCSRGQCYRNVCSIGKNIGGESVAITPSLEPISMSRISVVLDPLFLEVGGILLLRKLGCIGGGWYTSEK